MKDLATDLKKNRSHQNPKDGKHIVRFPRLPRRFPRLPIRRFSRRTGEDVAFFRTARLIGELEVKAHEWLARGREANTEFGRILIRLKPLVGHGHFKEYYERKFGQPYHIKFRTAQTYMKMAREQDKAKCAGLALFPPATDPHAVAIREAAERARQGVADAAQDSSSGAASNDANSICIFRPYIRMTREQRDRVAELWKSEHRHSVDCDVTDYLLQLCENYEITRGDSADSDD